MLSQEEYENLLQQTSSNKLFKESLNSIMNKENRNIFIFSCMICFIPSCIISFNLNTVVIYADIVSIFFDLILAMFGAVLTAFALLQVFLNKNIIRLFINDKANGIQKEEVTESDCKKKTNTQKFELQKTNESFTNILFLNLINIITIVLLSITLQYTPNDFLLFDSVIASNIICFILTELFFSFILYNVISVKSIIRDLYIFINLDIAIGISEINQEKEIKKHRNSSEGKS